MLYVFHVDVGQMMTFEMNLALENVHFLKETIERHHCIPAHSIVLLVSGGEILQNDMRICTYTAAGTDSNPIYMFSTATTTTDQSSHSDNTAVSFLRDGDLKKQVDLCLELPASFSTVIARTQMAQQIYDMGKDEIKSCEKLVQTQHFQQQGWAAVMANMEDLTEEFKERCDDFIRYFTDHLERRNDYIRYIESFDADLLKLSNVPILESLLENAESKPFEGLNYIYEEGNNLYDNKNTLVIAEETISPENFTHDKQKCLNLLEWISFAEGQETFRKMSENCKKGLDSFDREVMITLKVDIEKAVNAAKRDDMKEIKGLEDRLYGLEKLMSDAKRTLQAQNELYQSFQQHQRNANAIGDSSILPDLCESHRNQLVVMIKNHNFLRDIRRRCSKAKDELGLNLCQRLKFVIHVENKMSELDNTLLFYHTSLRRLQKHLGIIEQIHQAPSMYISAVIEVVRRRMFSSSFLRWSSELSCRMLTIYNDEVLRRREFSSIFEGHFLNMLFPGMDDLPPSYAIEAPSMFDTSLPLLTDKDVDELHNLLPLQEKDICVKSIIEMNKDYVFPSINEYGKINHDFGHQWTAEFQIRQENKEIINHQFQSAKEAMKSMQEAVKNIKQQLNLLKDNTLLEKSCIITQLEKIQKALSKIEAQRHELVEDNGKTGDLYRKINELQDLIMKLESSKKSEIQAVVEENEHKHRTELESLRCRYKLMTCMDKSPSSDTSLEKIERDAIDIVTHEQILKELNENFIKDKELSIKNAIEMEKEKWNLDLPHFFYQESLKYSEEKEEPSIVITKENELLSKVDLLEKENLKLEKELEKRANSISITSCSKGDVVMIVWNSVYEQYVVVQNAPYLYFLHAESYPCFNLTSPESNTNPKTLHCIGVVTDKDYCHARKDENRYKVSRGTRFYRVKVRPLAKESDKCIHKRSKQHTQPGKFFLDSRDAKDDPNREQKCSFKERNVSVTEEDYMEFNITEACIKSEQLSE